MKFNRIVKLQDVNLSLCLSTRPWRRTGSGGTVPRFLNLCTWMGVVSFIFRPLKPRERAPVPNG
jgi:hypothetical protein